jgi:AcrR family transcriptional regulator
MTTRGEQTRQHLLDVAEELFGARGFHAVSLREIRIASGARNTAAMQFHFGDRNGLVEALMARHMPRIAELQLGLFDRMVAEHRADDSRSLVEVLVRPAAEYLTWGAGGRAWVKIMAELSALPDLRANEMLSIAPAPAVEVGGTLFGQLCDHMPRTLAARRMVVLAQSAVQMCADRARIADADTGEDTGIMRQALPMAAFTENLIDITQGALFAPVSPETARALVEPDRPTPAGGSAAATGARAT